MTVVLATWVAITASQLQGAIAAEDAQHLTEAYIFVAVAVSCYALIEWTQGNADCAAGQMPWWKKYGVRLPLVVLTGSVWMSLPYLRGAYGVRRDHPVVEFLAKDRTYFCEVSAESPSSVCTGPWLLIDVGKQHAILRRKQDGKVYVVPSAQLNTFRVVGREKQ